LAVLEQFLAFFVEVETGMNNLRFTYLMDWWRHRCITLHITKF